MMELIEAIEAKRTVTFKYHKKQRRCEVYALGVSGAGNLVCRCYELPSKGFKLFLFDEMKNVKLEDKNWFLPRSGYNRSGDKSMAEVLKQV